MKKIFRILYISGLIILLTACSSAPNNIEPPQKTKEEIRAEILQGEWLNYEGPPRALVTTGFESPPNIKVRYDYPSCSYNEPELCFTNSNEWFFTSEEIKHFLNPLPIKEVISILHKSQMENPSKNILPSRLVSEITEIDVNGYNGYQFTTEWGFAQPCEEAHFLKGNLSGCGYLFPGDIKVKVMIVENKGEKLIIMIDEDNPVSKRILDSFEFVE